MSTERNELFAAALALDVYGTAEQKRGVRERVLARFGATAEEQAAGAVACRGCGKRSWIGALVLVIARDPERCSAIGDGFKGVWTCHQCDEYDSGAYDHQKDAWHQRVCLRHAVANTYAQAVWVLS